MSMLAIVVVLLSAAPQVDAAECPNDGFREGPSAALPGCRAYELISPEDANGRLLQPINTWELPSLSPEILPTEYAAEGGDSIVFMTYMSPLQEEPGGTGIGDVYEAQRGMDGWSTSVRLSPSGPLAQLSYKPVGVSSDHSYMAADIPLSEGSISPYLFGRDGSAEPVGLGSLGVELYPQVQYIGAGGEHVIFSTGKGEDQSKWCFFAGSLCKVVQLEPDAPPTGTGGIYDRSADGPTHVVSLLPGGAPLEAEDHAVYKGNSKDASSVAFGVNGTLFVRVHNGVDGEEATLKIAEGGPVFAGISDQGRYVFYVAGGN
jgi:hypothetical protein